MPTKYMLGGVKQDKSEGCDPILRMRTSGGSGTRKPENPTEISKTRTEPKPKIQIFEKPNRTETEITNRGYPVGNLSAF